jgi:penicillin-binding protein 2
MYKDKKALLNKKVRFFLAFCVAGLLFSVITVRLWYLQILMGDFFREKSENNRLQTVYVQPPRGLIKDRKGNTIVTNRASFNIEFTVEESSNPKRTLKQLSKLLRIDYDTLLKKFSNQRKRRKFEPKILLKDVSEDIISKVAVNKYRLPGVTINVAPARNYLLGEFAAHVIGYIREITKEQLESSSYKNYLQGDIVGQYGIESMWEKYLQGTRGLQKVIVNATGARIGDLYLENEIYGSTLNLTIDEKVQKTADEALRDKSGAIVALDVTNGDVLAMSSSPGFDPNIFTRELTGTDWHALMDGKKLMNKAIQGTYPPGSVFKIFMAIAGLAGEVINPKNRVHCPGSYWFAGRSYRCHKKEGHGSVDLRSAIVLSCDVYFYTLGQKLGIDRIHEYTSMFGLGERTGIKLPNEEYGLIPSSEWKRKAFKRSGDRKWYPGETLSVSIGQGAVIATPLQMARSMAAVVNGGFVFEPHLLKSIVSTKGDIIQEFEPKVKKRVTLDPKILEIVQDAMVGVVNDPSGTGKRAQLDKQFKMLVGGKTGTSQVVSMEYYQKIKKHKNAKIKEGKEHFEDHAWFVGYAPADNPKIAVAALIENGGGGGKAAAPVVQQVMTSYFAQEMSLPLLPMPSPVQTLVKSENKSKEDRKIKKQQVTPNTLKASERLVTSQPE